VPVEFERLRVVVLLRRVLLGRVLLVLRRVLLVLRRVVPLLLFWVAIEAIPPPSASESGSRGGRLSVVLLSQVMSVAVRRLLLRNLLTV
jgi:hypothetical protein